MSSPESSVAKKDAQEPKWQVFQSTNHVFVTVFVCASTYVLIQHPNADEFPKRQELLVAYLLLGGSLAYFFGFFGVFFVSQQDPTPISHHSRTPIELSNVQDLEELSDDEILILLHAKQVSIHQLETKLKSNVIRAIHLRRLYHQHYHLSHESGKALSQLPYLDFNYEQAHGRNCEGMIGFVQVPVGIVGPLTFNNETLWFPMATTEGCLVASTNRGCKAMNAGTGATSVILHDGITRAPCVRFPSAAKAASVREWLHRSSSQMELRKIFATTTRFGKMKDMKVIQASRNLYLRISCQSGDAMGMNMISKGTMAILEYLSMEFESMEVICVSGNVCTDKKPSAINWIEGRGKSIVCETIIPKETVQSVLKTNVESMVDVHIQKNLIGSAMAGSIGGFNAHAANLVAAVFLATGQDPAQVVESSNCLTHAEMTKSHDLYMSVTMPSIQVGTVGGGTQLRSQAACLGMVNAAGPSSINPGDNAKRLAQIIGAAVLAGEVSLLAALSAGDLVKSHMKHNRK